MIIKEDAVRSYPVYIGGVECGALNIYQDGLRTVFAVRCHSDKDGIIRLSVYGGEQSFPLGVMKREGESLLLRRAFTRSELKALPKHIDCAADSERVVKETDGGEKDMAWLPAPRGCLVCRGLLAIPADPARLGRLSSRLREIDGRCYLIFKRKM